MTASQRLTISADGNSVSSRQSRRVTEGRSFTLISVERTSTQRRQIESFIARRFAEAYGARINSFLPVLVALVDRPGNVVAAAGYAAAGDGPLFLERYLDRPIEAAFETSAGRPVLRDSVVEIGNLAARTPGGTRYIALAITGLLARLGFEWAAFTATQQVRNAIARCGLVPYDFGLASGSAMGEAVVNWGTYYDNDPRLVGGSLSGAAALLAESEPATSLPC
ncbi:MAG TPA: thermostable hemolysin [Burkholderiales bacterium]